MGEYNTQSSDSHNVWCSFQTYTIKQVPNGTKRKPSRLSETPLRRLQKVEHHRGEKKRTKWQGPSYFLWFLREQIQAISFSVKHEMRHASSSLTPFHSLFISLAHANLLVSDHVGFAWVVESCHSSNGYGVTKPSAVISAKSLAAQRRTVAECDWPPDASFGRWSDRQLEKCIEILRDREGMSGVGKKTEFPQVWFWSWIKFWAFGCILSQN